MSSPSAKLVATLDPTRYERHFLHGETRSWGETNCYVDLWIETLHGLGLDPIAGLAFCAAIDLEGDQFTFFKYPIADLEALYGLDVIELNVWRSLPEQAREQIELGRAVIAELDAFHLPDTAGNSYQTGHVKTSVTIETIDLAARRMNYFHGAGYWTLADEDYDGVFRLGAHAPAAGVVHLPPYVEVAKLGRRPALDGAALTAAVREQLRHHLTRRPKANPFVAFRAKLERDLLWLKDADLPMFHGYAFATVRQFGACFELLATFSRWLAERDLALGSELLPSATDFEEISTTAKTIQFKLARAVRGKPVDFSPMHDALEAAWVRGFARLDAALTP